MEATCPKLQKTTHWQVIRTDQILEMYTISYVTMCRVSVPSCHREDNNLSWYFKQFPWSTPLPIVSPIFSDKIHPPAYKFKCYADICSASGYSYFHRFSFFSIENVLVHQSIAWVNVNESGRSSIQFLKTIARLSGTILGLVQTNNFSRGGLKQKPENQIHYDVTTLPRDVTSLSKSVCRRFELLCWCYLW